MIRLGNGRPSAPERVVAPGAAGFVAPVFVRRDHGPAELQHCDDTPGRRRAGARAPRGRGGADESGARSGLVEEAGDHADYIY